MGLFEPHHLILILVIALVIFGPGKIADLGGSLGKSVRDFKKAMSDPEPTAQAPAAAPQPAPEPIRHAAAETVKAAGTPIKEGA